MSTRRRLLMYRIHRISRGEKNSEQGARRVNLVAAEGRHDAEDGHTILSFRALMVVVTAFRARLKSENFSNDTYLCAYVLEAGGVRLSPFHISAYCVLQPTCLVYFVIEF